MTAPLRWLDDEATFQRELAAGNAADLYVCTALLKRQLVVWRPEKRVRPDSDSRLDFSDDGDLFVALPEPAAIEDWHRVEVKSRRVQFTGPHDWPFDPIVCSLTAYCTNAKARAAAFVFVSKPTGHLCWLPNAQRDSWRIERKYDSVRRLTVDVYVAPRQQLRALDEFSDFLRELREDR